MEKNTFDVFNQCTKQLYKDLLEMYPNEGVLEAAQLAFNVYKALDEKGPCSYFYSSFVLPFMNHIKERNIDFFMKGEMTLPYFEKASNRIRMLWQNGSDADRNAIWDHINILVYLSEKAIKGK